MPERRETVWERGRHAGTGGDRDPLLSGVDRASARTWARAAVWIGGIVACVMLAIGVLLVALVDVSSLDETATLDQVRTADVLLVHDARVFLVWQDASIRSR